MNHLAYFAAEMTGLREREAEREIALRRKRIGDDDAPTRIRDRKWAAAIHRWALPRPATDAVSPARRVGSVDSDGLRPDVTPPAAPALSTRVGAGAGAATLGCASA
ncbi:hypothetical protein [Glaciibacter sp. 2TAF33]|uniref:hypothetical protein n=1 Tax=Glaciibacter sp. 2TAF33 TaxID=3233015 RepID=UPI003F8EF841